MEIDKRAFLLDSDLAKEVAEHIERHIILNLTRDPLVLDADLDWCLSSGYVNGVAIITSFPAAMGFHLTLCGWPPYGLVRNVAYLATEITYYLQSTDNLQKYVDKHLASTVRVIPKFIAEEIDL